MWGGVCTLSAHGFADHSEEAGLACDPHPVAILHQETGSELHFYCTKGDIFLIV